MTPALNWLEIGELARNIQDFFEGPKQPLHVERIIVPERSYFPDGYIKGEWALRLASRHEERVLIFSIRPRRPYVLFLRGKGPKASAHATRSPFDLALSKHIKGARLSGIEAIFRERVLMIHFEGGVSLALVLIPAVPEALLVRRVEGAGGMPILTRSSVTKSNERPDELFILPDGARAPSDLAVRKELTVPETLSETVERALQQEAFQSRLNRVEKGLRELLKQARAREKQSVNAAREAQGEPDWRRFGDLLKSVLHDPPTRSNGVFRIRDHATDEDVEIPCDPKLTLAAQVEKFYQLAKRRDRRLSESTDRFETFRDTARTIEGKLSRLPQLLDWKSLEEAEKRSGLIISPPGAGDKKRSRSGWPGRTFVSKDGFAIWVGKSQDENLELTFKHAKGNDLWLHVRGRPGAHAVIPLLPGKSAPLDTLIDAALLVIHYSGGGQWGKTEVDYAFKKYVKRIKNSKEASYAHNKTLIVEPDPARLKRLLGSDGITP